MFVNLRRLLNQFLIKTRTINNEPLNKVSLIVIILIDLFILVNVFTGLNDISQWHLSPSQTYPCYADWQNYRTSTVQDKDYQTVHSAISQIDRQNRSSWQQNYRIVESGHLGKVSPLCLQYAEQRDLISNSSNVAAIKIIDNKQSQISTLKQVNQKIQSQYDSTLLEKIAGQDRSKSINAVGAEKAKQELDQNTSKIATLDLEITTLKSEFLSKPASSDFLALLKNAGKFTEVKNQYQQADFWYPSIQLALQTLFLLPLIAIALLVHNFAQRKGYGLVALISWHLLAIFAIPLIIKVFEFLQIGIIFRWIFDLVGILFGRLLFLINFIYILLIPVVGFGIIKFSQKVVFNTKIQAAKRVQLSRCMNCARKIGNHDAHCPHCGYYQYTECQNCHSLTYKNLAYCKECGHYQDPNLVVVDAET
jgi:predicted RNA-binding Zn-ribbon protein involved in translation (DUF1610 family)